MTETMEHPAKMKKAPLPVVQLAKTHPAVFAGGFKPLRIGILEDLVKAHEGEISRSILRRFMAVHTSRHGYLMAVAAGGPRYSLDGSEDGHVTEEQQKYARERIARLYAVDEATHMAIKQRSLTLKDFESSGLGRREYAEKVGMTLDALCSDLDRGAVEREARRRERLRVVEKLEKSGLSPEEFAAREKISESKLQRIMSKVAAVRPQTGGQ